MTPSNEIDELLDNVYDAAYRQALTHASGGGINTLTSDTMYRVKTELQALITARQIEELEKVQVAADKVERMDSCGCDAYLPKRIAELKGKEK